MHTLDSQQVADGVRRCVKVEAMQTQLIFVDPAVKINGASHRDVLLTHQLLPVMQEILGDFFILEQDNITIKLLEWKTTKLIAPNLWTQPSRS